MLASFLGVVDYFSSESQLQILKVMQQLRCWVFGVTGMIIILHILIHSLPHTLILIPPHLLSFPHKIRLNLRIIFDRSQLRSILPWYGHHLPLKARLNNPGTLVHFDYIDLIFLFDLVPTASSIFLCLI